MLLPAHHTFSRLNCSLEKIELYGIKEPCSFAQCYVFAVGYFLSWNAEAIAHSTTFEIIIPTFVYTMIFMTLFVKILIP